MGRGLTPARHYFRMPKEVRWATCPQQTRNDYVRVEDNSHSAGVARACPAHRFLNEILQLILGQVSVARLDLLDHQAV